MLATNSHEVLIAAGGKQLAGTLTMPDEPCGIILFAHGSGSSRHSPRNQFVAEILQCGGFATLLMDLLTVEEERIDAVTGHLRFDIEFLANRLIGATDWVHRTAEAFNIAIGYFGASTGAAAALVAASRRREMVRAIVSRGGRPDLAGHALAAVVAPTLFIVGGEDHTVLRLNHDAMEKLVISEKRLRIVPGAGHLFEEPGAPEQGAMLAREWFARYLNQTALRSPWNLPQPVGI